MTKKSFTYSFFVSFLNFIWILNLSSSTVSRRLFFYYWYRFIIPFLLLLCLLCLLFFSTINPNLFFFNFVLEQEIFRNNKNIKQESNRNLKKFKNYFFMWMFHVSWSIFQEHFGFWKIVEFFNSHVLAV